MLRVIHITNNLADGAGRAVHRLHCELRELGVHSTVLVAASNLSDETVVSIGDLITTKKPLTYRLQRKFFGVVHVLSGKMLGLGKSNKSNSKVRPLLNFCFSSVGDLQLQRLLAHADVVCLYSIQGILSPENVGALQTDCSAKVVWIPLDIEPMTGGCHFAGGCYDFQNSCMSCPQAETNLIKAIVRRTYERKASAYKKLEVTVIATSSAVKKWLASSSLLASKGIRSDFVVGVDEKVFTPSDKASARRRLNLCQQKQLILIGAFNHGDKRKGIEIFKASLARLWEKYAANELLENVSNIKIVTIGRPGKRSVWPFEWDVMHLGLVDNDQKLSDIYNAVDLVVVPSIDDAGPMMVNEAVACGTPVVAFDVGVAPDLITTRRIGLIASEKTPDALAQAIFEMLSRSDEDSSYSDQRAMVLARKKVSAAVQAKRFHKLFLELTSSLGEQG